MSILAIALIVLGALIVTISVVLVIGAFAPRIPYVGAYGSLIWPTLIGPATIFVTIGTLLELVAFQIGGSEVALAFAAVGGLALLGTLIILGNQLIAAKRAGAPIRPKALVAAGLGPKSPPDDTATYTAGPDGEPLRIIVYRPRRTANGTSTVGAGAPIVVYVHGGGWFQGAPDENPAILRWFADQGYVVFAPAYTLATEALATWDIAMTQVAQALVWVGQHAPEYGGDPQRIAVWGASAGANLTLVATYAATSGKLPASIADGFPHIAAVAGEVPAVDPKWIEHNTDPIWGPKTREMVVRYIGGTAEQHPERLAAIQVETYLSPQAPPTLLTVSKGDHLVPVEGIRQFVDKASAAGVDIRAVYRPWGDHIISAIYDGLTGQTMMRLLLAHFEAHGV
ncbi:MAG: alpha/beta hydrolase [Ilumatobacteraceae bacterium]